MDRNAQEGEGGSGTGSSIVNNVVPQIKSCSICVGSQHRVALTLTD